MLAELRKKKKLRECKSILPYLKERRDKRSVDKWDLEKATLLERNLMYTENKTIWFPIYSRKRFYWTLNRVKSMEVTKALQDVRNLQGQRQIFDRRMEEISKWEKKACVSDTYYNVLYKKLEALCLQEQENERAFSYYIWKWKEFRRIDERRKKLRWGCADPRRIDRVKLAKKYHDFVEQFDRY